MVNGEMMTSVGKEPKRHSESCEFKNKKFGSRNPSYSLAQLTLCRRFKLATNSCSVLSANARSLDHSRAREKVDFFRSCTKLISGARCKAALKGKQSR